MPYLCHTDHLYSPLVETERQEFDEAKTSFMSVCLGHLCCFTTLCLALLDDHIVLLLNKPERQVSKSLYLFFITFKMPLLFSGFCFSIWILTSDFQNQRKKKLRTRWKFQLIYIFEGHILFQIWTGYISVIFKNFFPWRS